MKISRKWPHERGYTEREISACDGSHNHKQFTVMGARNGFCSHFPGILSPWGPITNSLFYSLCHSLVISPQCTFFCSKLLPPRYLYFIFLVTLIVKGVVLFRRQRLPLRLNQRRSQICQEPIPPGTHHILSTHLGQPQNHTAFAFSFRGEWDSWKLTQERAYILSLPEKLPDNKLCVC